MGVVCIFLSSIISHLFLPLLRWSGGAMVLFNFQCRSVLLIWVRVGQGPNALAVGAGGGCLNIFTLVYYFSFSLSLADGPI